jgi:hypothetical protein
MTKLWSISIAAMILAVAASRVTPVAALQD